MANFEIAYAITMKHEGGYAHDRDDAGGQTFAGISRRANPSWSGWGIVDAVIKLHGLRGIDARLFAHPAMRPAIHHCYKVNYWNVNALDAVLDQDIANEAFDIGVNCGVGVAADMLQEALNLCNDNQTQYADIVVDGKIGPRTLTLLNEHRNKSFLFKMINGLQAERYIQLMRRKSTQEKFARSWFSRVDFRKAA